MKRTFAITALFLSTLFAVPAHVAAQQPDGSDINQAIPIYFGQTVSGLLDNITGPPVRVYGITLAEGQTFSAALSSNTSSIRVCLFSPDVLTVAGTQCLYGTITYSARNGASFSYLVSKPGKYYIEVWTNAAGVDYKLTVTAKGTPIVTPNPAVAGCVSGKVDYITYSLQLIAAGLPDEASVGGIKLCGAGCTAKPPAYPEIAQRFESAIKWGINIKACYDSSGNLFQVSLGTP